MIVIVVGVESYIRRSQLLRTWVRPLEMYDLARGPSTRSDCMNLCGHVAELATECCLVACRFFARIVADHSSRLGSVRNGTFSSAPLTPPYCACRALHHNIARANKKVHNG